MISVRWDLSNLLAKVGLRRDQRSRRPPLASAAAQSALFCVTRTDFGHVVTCTSDKTIGESIRLTGYYSEANVGLALRTIDRLGHSVRLATFMDIGANIGTFSLYALKLGFEKAICIEPDPDNFRLLRANQILNDLDRRCVNFRLALSDRDGLGQLELSPSNFGDHRVRLQDPHTVEMYGEGNRRTCEVEMKRFDSLIEAGMIDPRELGIAWIDVQGHEGHIFAGARALLESNVPIVVEFWPYGLRRSGGYQMYRDALSRRTVYELQGDADSGHPLQVGGERLDRLYEALLQDEGVSHLDFVLL